ncbi:MAG: aminodeoxychorismate synthase component I [Ignavibacteriae bacterium]|nr:aminodeoxychorismate synthase component I [Ignavibacteriota bacterium]NOG98324.1 aminodeoxychorismate synthase component I [Ignavibacteriota bacterium]
MNIEQLLNTVTANKESALFYTPAFYKNVKSYLFENPVETIATSDPSDFNNCIDKIDELLDNGLIGYGYISYEAGYLLEEKLIYLLNQKPNQPLLKFRFFEKENVKTFLSSEINFGNAAEIIKNTNHEISNFNLNTDHESYRSAIGKIKKYIEEGDTYQVNYTVKGKFDFAGRIESLFLKLVFNQSARYSALINDDDNIIISISPELFFSNNNGEISTHPMKGTARRGENIHEDEIVKNHLIESGKNRAENIMIVDLLRNDFGRVSKTNSVSADSLYNIEKYESVYQMTSEVRSELSTNRFAEVIKNVFPCGSITGAPKIKTMEIINELENEARGIYTGAIGIVQKNNWIFNVGIRTILIDQMLSKGEIGIGSGIVWDSDADEEYNEVLLKSNFLIKPKKYFELFETMLIENGKIFLLDEHLERLGTASEFFLFIFDLAKISSALFKAVEILDASKKYKVKLSLTKWGETKIEVSEIVDSKSNYKVAISTKKIDSENSFYYFKTTNRELYSNELKKYSEQGFDEVIFFNEKDELCEGSFTNIFVKINDAWFTPPVNCGLLNGVYRQYLIDNDKSINEKILTMNDLIDADEIILTNSVRKTIKVGSIYLENKLLKKFNV